MVKWKNQNVLICYQLKPAMYMHITTTHTHIRRWWFYLIVSRGLKWSAIDISRFAFFDSQPSKMNLSLICLCRISRQLAHAVELSNSGQKNLVITDLLELIIDSVSRSQTNMVRIFLILVHERWLKLSFHTT